MAGVVPDVAFDLKLEHGRCVAVRLPTATGVLEALARQALLPEEQAHATTLGPIVRRTWIGGRLALRQALARSGLEAPPVLPDGRGAPLLPAGIAGSVSHKTDLAVALVARERAARLGVDVEVDEARPRDIASKVLTDEELRDLQGLGASARAREVLLRFSAKEAVYKALDPFVRRYVGFREVEVRPRPDGSASVTSRLPRGDGSFTIDVRWLRRDRIVLTTARVSSP